MRRRGVVTVVVAISLTFFVGAFTYTVRNLYAEGHIVSVTNIKEWLKQHPEVDPNNPQVKNGQTTGVVKVTSIKEWLKAHPNVDPKNMKTFDPPVSPSGLVPLTPVLTWKNPPDTASTSLLIVRKGGSGDTVLEANDIKGETFAVPKEKLEYSVEYVWQIAHVKKSSEIVDGGTFKFTTDKAPAPKLKK